MMSDKIYTKEDMDKIADDVVLFAKIFLDFDLDRENTELMRRFIDVEAKEMRYSYAQILNTHPSCHKMYREEDK